MAQDYAKQFYASKAWIDLAMICKVQAAGICGRCGLAVVEPKLLIAHHKTALTPDNINEPQIALNPELIEVLCLDCHNKEHRRFGGQQGVYLIWGSPLAGKSSYVRQAMQPGDMVVDMDALWMAVSSQERYIKPDCLRFNVFALRDALYDQIYTRYGQWQDCYIIGGFANPLERKALVERLGAVEVYIESTCDECIGRAAGRPAAWRQYIEKWWAEHEYYTRGGA